MNRWKFLLIFPYAFLSAMPFIVNFGISIDADINITYVTVLAIINIIFSMFLFLRWVEN